MNVNNDFLYHIDDNDVRLVFTENRKFITLEYSRKLIGEFYLGLLYLGTQTNYAFDGYQNYGVRNNLRGYQADKYKGKHMIAGQAEYRGYSIYGFERKTNQFALGLCLGCRWQSGLIFWSNGSI